jgi:hypothetical protein
VTSNPLKDFLFLKSENIKEYVYSPFFWVGVVGLAIFMGGIYIFDYGIKRVSKFAS